MGGFPMLKKLAKWLLRKELTHYRNIIADQKETISDLSRRAPQVEIRYGITREVFHTKVVRPIGNTAIGSDISGEAAAYRLGIQHALRHMEEVIVV
jgi:hypothetical protein